jgi:putative phage-type endonuclease
MNCEDLIQGSAEWHDYRCGRITSSGISDMLAKTRTGEPSALRANYMARIIAERFTGVPAPSVITTAMQWGIDKEVEARSAYELMLNVDVRQVGFVDHPRLEMCGCSPDGLVGDDGLIEIKCPNTATHIATLLSRKIETQYMRQMQWQMACTGRQWCDFISYDPRLEPRMQLLVMRVLRGNQAIQEYEGAAALFMAEMAETMRSLDNLYPYPGAVAA